MLPSVQQHPNLFSRLAFEDTREGGTASRAGVVLLNQGVFHCAGYDQRQGIVWIDRRRLSVKVSAWRAWLNPKFHVATPAPSTVKQTRGVEQQIESGCSRDVRVYVELEKHLRDGGSNDRSCLDGSGFQTISACGRAVASLWIERHTHPSRISTDVRQPLIHFCNKLFWRNHGFRHGCGLPDVLRGILA